MLAPRQRRWVSIGAVGLLITSFLFFASRAEGNIVPDPDIHDGGVWVTNEAAGVFGRTNAQIATVDTRLQAESDSFDVLQSGNVVLLRQFDPSSLTGVDPARALLIPGPELPADAEVGLGAETAALFNPDGGDLFVTRAVSSSAALGLDPGGDLEPIDHVEEGGSMVVGEDGLVHLLDLGAGEIRTWSDDEELVKTTSVPDDVAGATLTAVGDRPVLLSAAGELILPGRKPVDVGLPGAVVQEPGPAASGVLVAGDDALVQVRFDGTVDHLADDGTGLPARPVRVAGCAYAAWGGAPLFVQACDGLDPTSGSIGEMDAGSELRFRSNRREVTLNNLTDGSQLLFGEGDPIYIDNEWAEALVDEIEEDPDAEEEIDEVSEPSCASEDNSEPVANPDNEQFGTRPGRPVIVHPLRNDLDPDCDVLLLREVTVADASAGTAGIVAGGRAVQVEMDPDIDVLRFDYSVSDGRGGQASSTATVRRVADGDNSPPVLGDNETLVVTGGTVTHNVLATAYDPDGDVMRLTEARVDGVSEGSSESVKFNSRGEVTFTAGNAAGVVEIAFVVSDGRTGGEQSGILTVRVKDRRENQPPTARNDSVSTFVGREVVYDVLDNDTDPNGQQLSVVRAESSADATLRWDPRSPEIRVRSDKAGSVNVVYTITDGTATDDAVLRVDFKEPTQPRPPIAVRDEVLVTGGEPAYVPVLDNDVDPDGEVLVVLGVSGIPANVPVSVTVIRRSVLKITAATDLTEPFEFSYRISDGVDVDDGTVFVEPAPTRTENRPPVVVSDEYTVRAGGIASLPVLTNDSDPDGDALEIEAPPQDQPDADRDGRLFLSDDGQLRYEAPESARSTVSLVYSVRDVAENVASAELIIHVLPANADRNQPPIAPELIGRTVAGQRVAIPIPVTTMDPDGDSVSLLGIGAPPSKGTVVAVRADELVYEADRSAAGTDEFTYRVVDQFGEEATGTILVGVAGLPSENNPPIPTEDEAAVRPGDTVSIDVIGNDFDPDADPIVVSTDEDHAPNPALGVAEIDGGAIRYTAPDDPDVDRTAFRYFASDGRGGVTESRVTVLFRGDADNRAPVAIDDATEPQAPGTEMRLSLLDNDEDPDNDDLEIVEITLAEGTITSDGQAVDFVMPERPVQFTYVVSDGTDTARAAVLVPVLDPNQNRPPIAVLDRGIEVDTGESVTIGVLDNDEDPDGNRLHLLQLLGARHGSVDFDGNRVVFTASEDRYVGDAGFSYVVGDDADPAKALSSVGSVKLRITGDLNTAPRFTNLQVEVPQGGSRTIDLAGAVTDPDPDESFEFSLVEEPDAIGTSLDGSRLTVDASVDTAAGTTGTLAVRVSDGDDEIDGVVAISVIGSDRSLPVASADAAETVQGVPVDIAVLSNDVNPFPEQPLEIFDVGTPTGGAGTARVANGTLTFTPNASFFGETRFAYSIVDSTEDTSRVATGTVTVTVVGRPSAPPAPTCISGTSESVRVQWVAPSANGAPITKYVMRISGPGGGTGDRELSNASTQDIGGLDNGVTYTFQVGAVNRAVTEADAAPTFSPPSPPCTPDEVPGEPQPPSTEFGDKQLTVRWTPPKNDGSAVIRQHLTNTTTGKTQELGPAVTEYVWTGLQNGTSYRFTVTAENALGRGPTSGLSTGDPIPAGAPGQPPVPEARGETGSRDGFLLVRWTWSPNLENGDAVDRFRITAFRNGVQDQQVIVGGGARSQQFDTDNGVGYQFTVEAENKAGWSNPSAKSASAISAGRPLGQPSVSASEGDRSSTLTIGGSVDDNGAAISGYQYDVNSNGNWRDVPGNRVITGLSNGTTYRFRVRAVNSEGAGSASAPSSDVVPYGNPTTPSISSSRSGDQVTFNWSGGSANGRPLHNPKFEIRVGTGNWQSTGNNSLTRTIGYNSSLTVRVRVRADNADAARTYSAVASKTETTGAAPQPRTQAVFTGIVEPCGSGAGSCHRYNVNLSQYPANATYQLRCEFNTNGGGWTGNKELGSGRTNGSGSATDGWCHVGTLTQGRFRVIVNGQTYYSNTFDNSP